MNIEAQIRIFINNKLAGSGYLVVGGGLLANVQFYNEEAAEAAGIVYPSRDTIKEMVETAIRSGAEEVCLFERKITWIVSPIKAQYSIGPNGSGLSLASLAKGMTKKTA